MFSNFNISVKLNKVKYVIINPIRKNKQFIVFKSLNKKIKNKGIIFIISPNSFSFFLKIIMKNKLQKQ